MQTTDLAEKIRAIFVKGGDPRNALNEIRGLVFVPAETQTPSASATAEGAEAPKPKTRRLGRFNAP